MPDSATDNKTLTIIAFDYGLRRIGVAVGQTFTGLAQPIKPVMARDGIPDWDLLQKLFDEWQPDLLVVGRPLNMFGEEQEISKRADKFSRRLEGRFGLKIGRVDERLSSREAIDLLYELGGSGKVDKASVDSCAAALILESWFRENS
ncbi:Holliday junction resolvase RuvX [Pelagibaculum spongiae]|uniref:Putative pre-16S rRNA nuclease n=1 Tax=Pelagibaculum spongiae TaxID=2080658 RepID=A0A2V1H2G9_9GAMM|nr:Holliday junction resolvase RuvX [Pelagibaculum spongiae]PVZ72170.1 Holliday junction resolvase RuvX [Pelagibaculum spongiae]